MIKDCARTAGIEPVIKAGNKVTERNGLVWRRHEIGRDLQYPVDVNRRTHIGLHLCDDAGNGQRDDVTGAFLVQMNICNRFGAHMDACRTNGRAPGTCRAAANACTKCCHCHIDIGKTHRCPCPQTRCSCCFGDSGYCISVPSMISGSNPRRFVRPSASMTISSYWRLRKLPKVKLASEGSVARTPVRLRKASPCSGVRLLHCPAVRAR